MTYNEIIYFIKDLIKLQSDDSTIESEHILFALNKFRASVIKKYYESIKKRIPESAYQTICLDMESIEDPSICSGFHFAKSKETAPFVLPYCNVKIYNENFFSSNITLVPNDRFEYVGLNKFSNRLIYGTVNVDRYVYLKSANPIFLPQVKITAVFEDPEKAYQLDCISRTGKCDDIYDAEFPLEDALVSEVITLTLQEILGGVYRGGDPYNNANDDLNDINQFIRSNMKDRYVKNHLDGNDDGE